MRPEGRFAGRVCLVTGGGRGIGRAVALALAGEGGRVGVAARTWSQCLEVAEEAGGLAIEADVADSAACERAVALLTDRFGPPSVLVNAAGISPVRRRAEEHDVLAFEQAIDVNLIGAFRMAKVCAPFLLASGGAIVNIASMAGLVASPRIADYGASKAGLIQLTCTLAREWGDRGVHAHAVCPGYVETELTEELLAAAHLRDEIVVATALGRLATIDEVVAPVCTALAIDGGTTA